MPSERRLHPLSFLFSLGSQAKNLLLPGLLFLFTARTSQWGWEALGMFALLPLAIGSLFHYFFFRYRYDEDELVIRSGLIFRNERHVPYKRIQNIDAVENVLHRMLGVVEVRVQTGGGQEPEATLRVLPVAALEEMRRRVFEEKKKASVDAGAPAVSPVDEATPTPLPERALLTLPIRDLLLYGLIENRGMVVVGAAFGLLWEAGLMDRLSARWFGSIESSRGVIRGLLRSLFGGGPPPQRQIALTLAAFAVLLIAIRLISMVWAGVRLYGFTLARAGGDLRTRYGFFTRVSSTIPLHRVQTLTIREGPLHRLFDRASVRVDTAGGTTGEGTQRREWLAPLIRRRDLPGLLREVAPELDLDAVGWRNVSPRAFRRALKPGVIMAVVISLPFVWLLRWWDLALLAVLVAWTVVHAKRYVANLGSGVTEGAVFFRSGWLWRHVTVARFAKIQAVAMHESPFDRRASMASVHVDTAGAGGASHRVHIPYQEIADARALFTQLSAQAARTAFRW
jgi:putative membrane protein